MIQTMRARLALLGAAAALLASGCGGGGTKSTSAGTTGGAGTTPTQLRRVREVYDAARGGRDGRITVYLMTITGADLAERFEAEARAFGLDPRADVGVAGDAAEIRAAVRRWADAGADAVILQPGFDVDPAEFASYVGEHVSGHC